MSDLLGVGAEVSAEILFLGLLDFVTDFDCDLDPDLDPDLCLLFFSRNGGIMIYFTGVGLCCWLWFF